MPSLCHTYRTVPYVRICAHGANHLSPLLLPFPIGTPKGNLNYGCMSGGEPEVRGADRELKCEPYPWRQSGSPPVLPRLQGP